MLIKTERFELEIFGWRYLYWFHIDIGSTRYELYRDLDGKLTGGKIPRPESDRERAARLAREELEAAAAG